MKEKSVRFVSALPAAFIVFTIARTAWAFFTPGDYFANGNIMVEPTLIGFPVAGLLIGYFLRGEKVLLILSILGLLSIAYWLFVPDGWWAHSARLTMPWET